MKILSLDGGGIRGVLTARLLQRIAKECPGFLASVDLIAGTSTGGIIALKLAKDGDDADFEDVVRIYKDRGAEIFKPRDWIDKTPAKVRLSILVMGLASAAVLFSVGLSIAATIVIAVAAALVGLLALVNRVDEMFRADFSSDDIRLVLEQELGPVTLGNLKKKVLIPTFDLRKWNTKFYDNFDESTDKNTQAVDVARSTSAAPTYWPTHNWQMDGGLFANNPSDSAVASAMSHMIKVGIAEGLTEATAVRSSLGKISVLSIGTGEVPHRAPSEKPSWDAGVVDVVPLLLNVVMDGAVKASHFRTKVGLGDRYLRINPKLPTVMDLADVGSVPDLIKIADMTDIGPAVSWVKKHWTPASA